MKNAARKRANGILAGHKTPSDFLGRKGENAFEKLCINAHLFCNKADWDRTGWDYIVEFPASVPMDERLDSRPAPPEARIQVKAVGVGKDTFTVRLSSAERLAKSPGPAFFCVFVEDETYDLVDLYFLHVRGSLLSKILRELRIALAKNSLTVNRKFIKIPFASFGTKSRVTDFDLRGHLLHACGTNPTTYVIEKSLECQNLGFNAARYKISFETIAQNQSEVVDAMLGLKTLQARNVHVQEIRWDIPISQKFGSSDAEVRVQPHPRRGKLVINAGDSSLTFYPSVYIAQVPGLSVDQQKLRLEDPLIEVLFDFAIGKADISYPAKPGARLSIRDHMRVNKLRKLLYSSKASYRLWIDKQFVLSAALNLDDLPVSEAQTAEANMDFVGRLLSKLERIAIAADCTDLELTVREINEQIEGIDFLDALLTRPGGLKTSVKCKRPSTISSASGTQNFEILLVYSMQFSDVTIYAGAVGEASLLFSDETVDVRASKLQIRRLECCRNEETSVSIFRTSMQAETGLASLLEVSRPYILESE